MKIGVMGAPDAGKSKFARKLALGMAKTDVGKTKVIDSYVDKLIEQTGYAFGYFATYPQNFQVIFQRWTLEQIAQTKGLNTITCGTLYESIMYCAIKADVESRNQEDLEAQIFARTAMNALGMIETQISDYDILFHLPYDGKKLLEKGKSYDTLVDRKTPEILAGYYKSAVVLSGTEKENVKYATQIIQAVSEEASENEQQTVRGSGVFTSEEPQEI